jgi:hypothetical protein
MPRGMAEVGFKRVFDIRQMQMIAAKKYGIECQ